MKSEKVVNILMYFLLIVLSILICIPLFYLVRLSTIKTYIVAITDYFAPINLWNYITLLTGGFFPRWMLNSIIISTSVTILNVLIVSAAGYALSQKPPFSNNLFALTLLSMSIPGFIRLVPLYILFAKMNLTNTYFGIIFAMLGTPFSVFLMRQFFISIPIDYRESALLDGCSEWNIITKIYLPIAKPALIVVALTEFINSWNEFTIPLVMVSTSEMATVPLGIATYITGLMGVDWGIASAASVIGSLPTIILFIMLSEHYMRGLVTLALKR